MEGGTDQTLFRSLSGANLLIAVGFIIMFVGFLGCCGAIRESQFLLMAVSLYLQYILFKLSMFTELKEVSLCCLLNVRDHLQNKLSMAHFSKMAFFSKGTCLLLHNKYVF